MEACEGIIEEGRKVNKAEEARILANDLKAGPLEEVFLRSAGVYSKDTFLYREMNKALRTHDNSKLNTFGPFCFLFNTFLSRAVEFGSLYRNASILWRGIDFPITEDWIETLKLNKDTLVSWHAFTSTTKRKSIASNFGNLLFQIFPPQADCCKQTNHGADISTLSEFKDEEEVVFPPETCFIIKAIKQCDGKWIIELGCDEPQTFMPL